MRNIFSFKFRTLAILLTLFVLAACVTKPPRTQPGADVETAPEIAHEIIQRYSIDPALSSIHIHAFPDGPLAKFGHNHLIAVNQLEGELSLSDPLEASQLSLSFLVAEMSVDDPALRKDAGEMFQALVPQKDRDGTRTNMLSPNLLNGERYPRIAVQSHRISGTWPNLTAELSVSIAGTTQRLTVDANLKRSGNGIEISSAFAVTHAEIGLQPFSAMLGALKVRDTLDIELHIRAQAVD
ncbi:MAG: YceI family protein [Pseudomonadota bacterium]